MFRKIYNPETKRYVDITGTVGKSVLRKYVKQLGGGKCSVCGASGVTRRTCPHVHEGKPLGRHNNQKLAKMVRPKKAVAKPKKVVAKPKKVAAKPKKVAAKPKKVAAKPKKAAEGVQQLSFPMKILKDVLRRADVPKYSPKSCEMYKVNKKNGSKRISAKCYYDTFGKSGINDKCSPAYSGGPGFLALDKNSRPSWKKSADPSLPEGACKL